MTHTASQGFVRHNGVSVIACEQCEFSHVDPLPSPEELRALYDTLYYADIKPDYFAHDEEDRAWWDLVHEERVAMIERWIDADPVTRGGRSVLDVGSGPGGFLRIAQRRKWEGIGLEPSRQAYEYSTKNFGLTVFQRSFDAAAVETWRDFHAVHMSEVLEHVGDAAETLRLAHQALRPGGVLLLVVPNDFNVLQGALIGAGSHQPWWVVPEHVNYFNVNTLHALVRRCGFSVADVTCTFPMEFFLLCGMDYVGHDEVGRVAHALRKRFEVNCELMRLGDMRRQMYRALMRYGFGRDIVMLCRKPTAKEEVTQ